MAEHLVQKVVQGALRSERRMGQRGAGASGCWGGGAQVTAGTVIYEAPITIRAASTGAGSTLAGIGRLVAAAQVLP